MLGGAWYDKYLKNLNESEMYELAMSELQKHLQIEIKPENYDLTVMKDCIPQYNVGHLKILKEIEKSIKHYGLDKKLYLIGHSYKGIGVNQVIINAKQLVTNNFV
jgi:protoporphyrinogen/coproporphyrinogen III oxidase